MFIFLSLLILEQINIAFTSSFVNIIIKPFVILNIILELFIFSFDFRSADEAIIDLPKKSDTKDNSVN